MIPHRSHWLTKFALSGTEEVCETLREIELLNPILKIADYHLEAGRFSLLPLSRIIKDFRNYSNTPVEIFRADIPSYNYSEMIKYHESEPESFAKLSNVFTYFSPGNHMKQIYPNNSISLQYISHLLSAFPSKQPAPDHIFPSLSSDETIKEQRIQGALKELQNCLTIKHAELIPGGRIYFDVMGTLPQNNIFDIINKVAKNVISNNIAPPEFANISIGTHFRTRAEVENAINGVQHLYRQVSYKEVFVKMPHLEDFENDGDIDKYAEGVVLFWKKIFEIYCGMHLGAKYPKEEIQNLINQILSMIRAEVVENKPIAASYSHHIILEKIREA
ncbi:unnamed protein product [Blepharisma stoltei]|uniref:Uncharacterized protein n=1 Tax=Blepharisma stoltei TaxID=1481888 RepID=A0AAU9JZC2_9CILI|nr:unnamed protein product [Blepharisma stoltei]